MKQCGRIRCKVEHILEQNSLRCCRALLSVRRIEHAEGREPLLRTGDSGEINDQIPFSLEPFSSKERAETSL